MKIRKSSWTVLLLRPDYVADTFGQDTLLVHATAESAKKALEIARADACLIDKVDLFFHSPEDYYCLLCTHGHLQDLSDGYGGVGR